MNVLTDERWYSEIGNAIRARTGTSASYAPSQMADAIRRIDNGSGMFADCIAMGKKSIALAFGISATRVISDAFLSDRYVTAVGYPMVSEIGQSAFAHCSSLSWVSFPNCLVVQNMAFRECAMLGPTVALPECTSIGVSAFYGCGSLKRIELPKCIRVGQSAFANCKSLEYAHVPSVTEIGSSAFRSCSLLTSISLPECVRIGSYGFNTTGLSSVHLPRCSVISMYAFASCRSLSNVRMDAVESIARFAFRDCDNLTSLDLTNVISVPALGSSVFSGTPMHENGSGRIYVHGVMYERFLESAAWASLSANIVSVT